MTDFAAMDARRRMRKDKMRTSMLIVMHLSIASMVLRFGPGPYLPACVRAWVWSVCVCVCVCVLVSFCIGVHAYGRRCAFLC